MSEIASLRLDADAAGNKKHSDLLGAIARGWCHAKNENKVMDPDLATAIATEVAEMFPVETESGVLPPVHERPRNVDDFVKLSQFIVRDQRRRYDRDARELAMAFIMLATREEPNAIDQYQQDANATCAPADQKQILRFLQCNTEIQMLCNELKPLLKKADEIKKYVFYGRVPSQNGIRIDEVSAKDLVEFTEIMPRLDNAHAILGILSEGEELLPALRRCEDGLGDQQVFEDIMINLGEEYGDVSWYVALGSRGCGTALKAILDTNIAKLKKRYPEKFTQDKAINRDLDGEQKLLKENFIKDQPLTQKELANAKDALALVMPTDNDQPE